MKFKCACEKCGWQTPNPKDLHPVNGLRVCDLCLAELNGELDIEYQAWLDTLELEPLPAA